MTGTLDANTLLQNMNNWGDMSASVAQPAYTPAVQLAPMSSLNAGALSFGQPRPGSFLSSLQTSNDPFSYQGTNGELPNGVTPPAAQGAGWKGWLQDGNNLGTVVQGLGALTNAYLGFKQLSMAKDNLRFQKDAFAKNFANSQQTYNTSLEDRIRGRSSNPNEADVQAYLAKHKLGG